MVHVMKIQNLFSVNNKIVIVTGAARGNGFAIAKGFAESGAIVFFIDKLKDILDENIKTVKSKNVFPLIADLTMDKDRKHIVEIVKKKYKRIDVLVNNAGITIGGKSSEVYSEKDWQKTLDVNLTALFVFSQLIVKEMIRTSSGSIINITSLGAEFGFPDNPGYVASKGAVKSLSRAMAYDFAKYNIRVNSIMPGYMVTDMTKKSFNDEKLYKERLNRMLINRWGKPEDLIGAALFLASEASNYITGIDLKVDGGWSVKGI